MYDANGEVAKDLNSIAAVSSLPESITAEGGELNGKLTFTSIEESMTVPNYNKTLVNIPLHKDTATISLTQINEAVDPALEAAPSTFNRLEPEDTHISLVDRVPWMPVLSVEPQGTIGGREYRFDAHNFCLVEGAEEKCTRIVEQDFSIGSLIYANNEDPTKADVLSWKAGPAVIGEVLYYAPHPSTDIYEMRYEGKLSGSINISGPTPVFSFHGLKDLIGYWAGIDETYPSPVIGTASYYKDGLTVEIGPSNLEKTIRSKSTFLDGIIVYEGLDELGPFLSHSRFTQLTTGGFRQDKLALGAPAKATLTKEASRLYRLVLNPVTFTGTEGLGAEKGDHTSVFANVTECKGKTYAPLAESVLESYTDSLPHASGSVCRVNITAPPHLVVSRDKRSAAATVKYRYLEKPSQCSESAFTNTEEGVTFKLCSQSGQTHSFYLMPTYVEKLNDEALEKEKEYFEGESRIRVTSGALDYSFESYYFDGDISITGALSYTEPQTSSVTVLPDATVAWLKVDIKDGAETKLLITKDGETLYDDITERDLVFRGISAGTYQVKATGYDTQDIKVEASWYEPAEFELKKHPLLDTYDYYYTISEKVDMSATSEHNQETSFEEETTGDPVTLKITDLDSSKILPDEDINVTIKVPYPFNVTFDGGSTQYTTAVSLTPRAIGKLYIFCKGETYEYLGIPGDIATTKYVATNASEYIIYYKSEPQEIKLNTYSNMVSTSSDAIEITSIQPPTILFDLSTVASISSSKEYIIPTKMSTVTLNDAALTTNQAIERIVDVQPQDNKITASFAGGTTDVYLFVYYSTSTAPIQNSGKVIFNVETINAQGLPDCQVNCVGGGTYSNSIQLARANSRQDCTCGSCGYAKVFEWRGGTRMESSWTCVPLYGLIAQEEATLGSGILLNFSTVNYCCTNGWGQLQCCNPTKILARGVRWDTGSKSAGAGSDGEAGSSSAASVLVLPDSEQLYNIVESLIQVCGEDDWLTLASKAGSICTHSCYTGLGFKRLTPEADIVYNAGGGVSHIVKDKSGCIPIASGTQLINTAKVERTSFTLPDIDVEQASLYLTGSDDMKVKAIVNNNLEAAKWVELKSGRPAKIDVSGLIIPGTTGNQMDLLMDPKDKSGNYEVDWNVQVK